MAMLAGKSLDEVIAVVGYTDALKLEGEEKVVAAFGLKFDPRISFAVSAFGLDSTKALGHLIREHKTLLCSVLDYNDVHYAHAVVIHNGQLFDPSCGMNPTWPWSRVISQASPVDGIQ